ncbi:hypothetical protein HK096_008137, partial [Nowakowskiella sp. JEL0078]
MSSDDSDINFSDILTSNSSVSEKKIKKSETEKINDNKQPSENLSPKISPLQAKLKNDDIESKFPNWTGDKFDKK